MYLNVKCNYTSMKAHYLTIYYFVVLDGCYDIMYKMYIYKAIRYIYIYASMTLEDGCRPTSQLTQKWHRSWKSKTLYVAE